MSSWVFGRVDVPRAWSDLGDRRVNYAEAEVRPAGWHFDEHRVALPREAPGPPEPGGVWERACRLVRDYEFTLPDVVRAVYDPDAALLGRDMLLEARFHGIHFYCGVRVTGVVDETRANGDRVWGWAYDTLEGHLERGRVTYEVLKSPSTGHVQFVASSHSQGAPTLQGLVRLGWGLFGRRTQLRFYRGICARMRRLVADAEAPRRRPQSATDGLVLAPSDAHVRRLDGLALHQVGPG